MARKIEVVIVGDSKSLESALDRASHAGKKTESTFKKLGKAGLIGAGAAGVGALIYTLKTGIGEFQESQKVAAQTAAVIKSTGGAARVTAKDVDSLAGALMKKSGIDDEAIASGENMLLTFTKIRNEVGKGNDVFNQATKATLDLSVATGKDMTSASVLVGKALNDPIKGLTALTRVGVSFSDGQRKAIEHMVKMGDTAGAQKIILKELNKEFGGSAEALGNTVPGAINIAKQTFANWSGELVAKTIPILQQTIAWLRDHWPEISAKINEMWTAAKPVFVQFGALVATVAGLIRQHWGTIGPVVQAIANVVKTQLAIMAGVIKVVVALLKGDWMGAWNAAKQTAGAVANYVKAVVSLAFTILEAAIAAVVKIAKSLWEWLGKLVAKAWKAVFELPGIQGILDTIKNVYDWLEKIAGTFIAHISISVSLPGGKAGKVLDLLIGGARGLAGTVLGPIVGERAAGGPVGAGRPYLVGERGQELFVPRGNGTIIPNHRLGGGMTVNLYAPNYIGSKQELLAELQNVAQRYFRQNGRSAFA